MYLASISANRSGLLRRGALHRDSVLGPLSSASCPCSSSDHDGVDGGERGGGVGANVTRLPEARRRSRAARWLASSSAVGAGTCTRPELSSRTRCWRARLTPVSTPPPTPPPPASAQCPPRPPCLYPRTHKGWRSHWLGSSPMVDASLLRRISADSLASCCVASLAAEAPSMPAEHSATSDSTALPCPAPGATDGMLPPLRAPRFALDLDEGRRHDPG